MSGHLNINNLFASLPPDPKKEVFQTLQENNAFKLERIISTGQATPPGEWYDQERDEWVVLLSGSAGLKIEGEDDIISLEPGDYIMLPAHIRHRVEWTDEQEPSIWLALHFDR